MRPSTPTPTRASRSASVPRVPAARATSASAPRRPRSRTPARGPPSRPPSPLAALPSSNVNVLNAGAVDDVVACVTASPLLKACGLTHASVAADAAEFARLGAVVSARIGLPPFKSMNTAEKSRVYQYYLPVFAWVRSQVAAHAANGAATPLVVGISAPQGCGKTTLVAELEALAPEAGLVAASVSIDDFYLTRDGQAAAAAASSGNPLLELRGNAGSHDLALGTATLDALIHAPSGATIPLPRYDKAAYGGLGDRAPEQRWPAATAPVDVVLLEGWMLGFAPVGAAAAAAVSPHLPAVDAALAGYKEAWDSRVDSWLVVDAPSPACVYAWRAQAEVALRAAGKGGMSDEQVADFVDRYMPAYEAYLPGLRARGPTTAKAGKLLVVAVDETRALAPVQPAPAV